MLSRFKVVAFLIAICCALAGCDIKISYSIVRFKNHDCEEFKTYKLNNRLKLKCYSGGHSAKIVAEFNGFKCAEISELPGSGEIGMPVTFILGDKVFSYIPYYVGGGSGVSEYRWVGLYYSENGYKLLDLGFYKYSISDCRGKSEEFLITATPELSSIEPIFKFEYRSSHCNSTCIYKGKFKLEVKSGLLEIVPCDFDSRASLRDLSKLKSCAGKWARKILKNEDNKGYNHEENLFR